MANFNLASLSMFFSKERATMFIPIFSWLLALVACGGNPAASVLPFAVSSSSGSVTNPQNAVDGDHATFAHLAVTAGGQTGVAVLVLSGPTVTPQPTTATLKILSRVNQDTYNVGTGQEESAVLDYSFDGFATSANVFTVHVGGLRPTTADAITLPPNSDLSKLQVRLASICPVSATLGTGSVDVFEVWIETP